MNIQERQRAFTDKILFEYYLVSSVREEQVFSPFPYYLDQAAFKSMTYSAEVLDRLTRRIIVKALENPELKLFQYGQFPKQEDILGLTNELMPFFWGRYDAFQRECGGIFFSEFNYDKPCAQRETAVSEMLKPYNSPNSEFTRKFREGFKQLCSFAVIYGKKPCVAILVDPGHYEEVHLAQLYIDILKPLGYEFIIAGGSNLYVAGDRVLAFDKEIDIILRQYPTEFLYELPFIEKILKLHNEGRVLVINDPRAIISQTKSLFAYLWEMVETGSGFLTDEEIRVIRDTIPYTRIFDHRQAVYICENKDKYVLKAAYGRYSEEVYIGRMCTDDEWSEVLQYLTTCDELYIVQDFCPIKKERVLRYNGNVFEDCDAFGNFGIYLINGEFSGICVRWSSDYLSSDEVVWSSAVGIREKSLKTKMLADAGRKQKWMEINEEAAFKWGYTDNYTNTFESFLLQGVFFDNSTYSELKEATEKAVDIVKKAARLVQDNSELLCPVLGINEKLRALVSQKNTDVVSFIGRFDWAYDSAGRLKLLEFNAETPAGLLEGMALSELIKEKLNLGYSNPNDRLGRLIEDAFIRIVKDYSRSREIKNIGFVSSPYHEDWYNTTIIHEQLKHLPYNFMLGDVAGLEGGSGKLKLYGVELDAIYRYYPLDWFENDSYFEGVIESLLGDTLSINPPSTLIYQSKAFLALVWELLEKGFYNEEEGWFIRRYIPRTTLAPRIPGTWDFCIKPLFGREGTGIAFSNNLPDLKLDCVEYAFQERIDIQPLELNIFSALHGRKEIMYPVIGTYVAGDSFAGIFTRAGSRITDKWSIYLPVYLEEA
jgi:Glutathionylspermidine synthase